MEKREGGKTGSGKLEETEIREEIKGLLKKMEGVVS